MTTPEKKFYQYLKCEFTDAEMTDRAKDLATANRRRSAIEQQKKEIDSDLKAKIEEQNSTIQRLSEAIATGFEYRDVECRVILDSPKEGQKTIVRLDTGEEAKIAPMDDADRQFLLDLQTKAADAEAKTNGAIVTPPPNVLRIDGPAIEVMPPEAE